MGQEQRMGALIYTNSWDAPPMTGTFVLPRMTEVPPSLANPSLVSAPRTSTSTSALSISCHHNAMRHNTAADSQWMTVAAGKLRMRRTKCVTSSHTTTVRLSRARTA